MTRYAMHLGLLIVLATLALLVATPARAEGAGLHGRVFALDETGDVKDVVVGAEIQLLDASGTAVARTTSQAGGYYKVSLPAGTYHYKVTAAGFEDEDVKRGVRQELTQGFSVFDFALSPKQEEPDEPEDATEDGDDETPPAGTTIPAAIGTLFGQVQEPSSDGGLIGIADAVVRLTADDGGSKTQVRTDEQGGYAIVLPTGSWHAVAYASGYEALVDAEAIEIAKGQRTNRDFLFQRARPPSVPQDQGIRGTIRLLADPDARATKRPTPTVSVVPLTPKATQGAAPGVDAQGAYRSGLAVGRYEVVASATGYETARSGPRQVHAGRATHVDLTLRASPASVEPPEPKPVPVPVVPPQPTPEPIPDPEPPPKPTPAPRPGTGEAELAIQVLERGPDRVLRVVSGATVTTGREEGGAAGRTTDANGWCNLPLASGEQHLQIRGGGGDTATLDLGYLPGGGLVDVHRRDANGEAHLELRLPVVVQVVLGSFDRPEDELTPEEARETRRLVIHVVERIEGERAQRPVDGARVSVMLGEDPADTGTTKDGVFTSKPLHVVPGYYALVQKEGYGFAEEMTPIEKEGPHVFVLHRARHLEEPPGREPPPPDGMEHGERAELRVRVIGPDGQAVRGAVVEVHWGPEGRDEVRARGATQGREPVFRASLQREDYWVTARAELPGRGSAWGEAGVPHDWDPKQAIVVQLDAPEGPGPGQPQPSEPPKPQPGRTPPAPLQIQVLGPDGRPLAGAHVEVLWGRSKVRGRAASQLGTGIARFNLPREEYWARATAPSPRGGVLTGQVGVPRQWNPAVPIRLRLHQEGGAPQPTPAQPGPPKPLARKAQLTVRVSGLDLNAPISTLQPLGGARVTVRGNGGTWSGLTNPGGTWRTPLAPGSYQIEVTAPGMERAANAGATIGNRDVTKELTIKLRGPR